MEFVKVKDNLEMAIYPVTQAQWAKQMDSAPSYFKGDNRPVEQVSYNDVQEFLKKVNSNKRLKYIYRLPTEQEWQDAAKSCDEQDIKEIAWCCENSEDKTHDVGLKKPNALGLFDMLGNVWEWTDSLWNKNSSSRVFRGGSWVSNAQVLRAGYRVGWGPSIRYFYVGFRLVRTPKLASAILPSDTRKTKALEVAQRALKEIEELLK